MRTKLSMVNAAVAAFGSTPLQDVEDETPAGRTVRLNYDLVVDACLGFYPWSFNKMTVPLARIDEEPVNGYRFAFAMPTNRLSLPIKLLANPRCPDDPYKDWTVEGGKVYADAEQLWGVFGFRVPPEDWPPVFAAGVTYALASAFVIPLTGNATGVAEAMQVLAFGTPSESKRGGWIGQAIAADTRNQPSRSVGLGDSPLADARVS